MDSKNSKITGHTPLTDPQVSSGKAVNQGSMILISEQGRCLDSAQLDQLEQSFRCWAEDSPRKDIRLARRRILVVFLLIRYTGAKLNEVLVLDPIKDIDFKGSSLSFANQGLEGKGERRRVHISVMLCSEIQEILADPSFKKFLKNGFDVDPGFVRRKFYERAQACGFSKDLGGPEMLRRARAVELMQANMPMPAVQKMLGHSNLNLTGSYVSFSAVEIQRVTELFMEREASRKTSARNSFFGKIQILEKGDIQTRVSLTTIGGYSITTIVTNDSIEQLALKKGLLVTAEVKAPWIILQGGEQEPKSSAENRFHGVVERINKGKINAEYTVRISDGTALCAVVSTEGARRLSLDIGDQVWALFNCFAVVLNVD